MSLDVPVSFETAVDLVDATNPYTIADRLVDHASEAAGAAAGLYVIDIGGSTLQRVAGAGRDEIAIPITLGPELPERHAELVVAALAAEGLHVEPLWLRARASAVLIFDRPVELTAQEVRAAAGAVDLAARYTDRFQAARRRKLTTPAAELQETLLPARVAEVRGADVAGTVLPAYEVGGDWFDYAEDEHGTWIAVGDAAGKGPQAAALSALVVSAMRGTRRQGAGLHEVVGAMHRIVREVAAPDGYVTAIVGRWDHRSGALEYLCCGHPPPLLMHGAGGEVHECDVHVAPPLGVPTEFAPERNALHLGPDDRLVLYSDGVTERRLANGDDRLGVDALRAAMRAPSSPSAASLATTVLDCVLRATDDPLADDATVLVLRAL